MSGSSGRTKLFVIFEGDDRRFITVIPSQLNGGTIGTSRMIGQGNVIFTKLQRAKANPAPTPARMSLLRWCLLLLLLCPLNLAQRSATLESWFGGHLAMTQSLGVVTMMHVVDLGGHGCWQRRKGTRSLPFQRASWLIARVRIVGIERQRISLENGSPLDLLRCRRLFRKLRRWLCHGSVRSGIGID